MANIGTLYLYELKKILNRRIVWVIGLVILSLCVFLSPSDLITTSVSDGDTEISGFEAMKINRDYARNLSGRTLDDRLLGEMQENCFEQNTEETAAEAAAETTRRTSTGGQVSVTAGNAEGHEDGGIPQYAPIYSYVQEITEDRDLTQSIDAGGLYAIREKAVYGNRSDQMLSDAEYGYWKNKDSGIETPFVYRYADGWGDLWEYAYTLNYLLFLLLAVCLSGVFFEEYSRKTDAIILCSKNGKKQLYFAKILAGATFSMASAILIFGTALLTSLLTYGADGFGAALQIAFPLSSWNVSVGESILVLFLTFIIISLLYGSMVMFLSETVKNSVAVMAIPVGIMFLTMMVDIPYQFRLASQVYDLLPTNLLVKWALWDDRLFSVLGQYFTNYQIAPMVYFIAAFLLVIIGKTFYQRHQVQAR